MRRANPTGKDGGENLAAKCLLVIACLAATLLLWWFQAVIVPFLFSCFFMYLIDPVVTCMLKTPTGCLDKCNRCSRWTRRTSLRVTQNAQHLASPLLPLRALRTPTKPSSGSFEHSKDDIQGCCLYFVNHATCPRWVAVIFALSFSLACVVVLVLFVIQSCMSVQSDWERYERGWTHIQDEAVSFRAVGIYLSQLCFFRHRSSNI